MSHFRLLLAVVSALALSACAQTAPKSDLSALPPPAAINASGSGQSAGAGFGTSTDGVQTSNAGAGQKYPTVPGPDGAVWLKPEEANEAYRIDADSCYSYARAQINHDARIESDAGTGFRNTTSGIGVFQLRQRMSNFARSKRVPRLFGQCMEAKGYTRG